MSEKEEKEWIEKIVDEYLEKKSEAYYDLSLILEEAFMFSRPVISSLQSENERLKKEIRELIKFQTIDADVIEAVSRELSLWKKLCGDYPELKSENTELKAEIERLKSNEGVKELLRKQREICEAEADWLDYPESKRFTCGAMINAPEPIFEVEEKKEDTLNKE